MAENKKYLDMPGLTYFYNQIKSKFASKTDVSTPLTASTIAAMTDHDKVYVYTGSESGHTFGDWYYYEDGSWHSAGQYRANVYETDKTLSVADKPADGKKTGDEIADLKSAIGVHDVIEFEWNDKCYIPLNTDPVNLTPVTNQGLECAIIDCAPGEKFVITASGGNSSRPWGFVNSSNHILDVADANTQVNELEKTAPANSVKLIVNNFLSNDGRVYKIGDSIINRVVRLENSVSILEPTSGNNDIGKVLTVKSVTDGKVSEYEFKNMTSMAGLTEDVKAALLNCFAHVAWTNENGRIYYGALQEALGSNVTSITALFNQNGNVFTSTDKLDDLKPFLTVYGDGITEIHGYSLSGDLSDQNSTITVTYNGLTTTFNVLVSKLPSGYTLKNYVEANGSQYITSGIYETDMLGKWIRHKECVTALNDKAGHILSSANEFIPYARHYPPSSNKFSYQRFGSQNTSYLNNDLMWNLNEDLVFESYKDGGKVFVNGAHMATIVPGTTANSSKQLYFFTYGESPTSGQFRFYGKLYYLKIFNADGTKAHDFIPCRNSSNVAGLYDMVTGVFHAPAAGTLSTN